MKLSPLNKLLLEAGSLLRYGKQSPAARHCAAVEAARCPKIEADDVGRAKSLAAFGLKQLMQSAEEFRNREARDMLMAAIASTVAALKREPDVQKPPPEIPYWLKDDYREPLATLEASCAR